MERGAPSKSTVSRFTSCQLKAVASKDKGAHFSANWHGNPYRGKVEVWLSPDEFKFGRVFLSYEGELRPGPHGKQLELFNYDPDNTEFPKPQGEAELPYDTAWVCDY